MFLRSVLVGSLIFVVAPVATAAPPAVTALAYHPDGQILAAGTRGTVVLIDSTTGEERATIPGQDGRVTAVAFSKTGLLAAASGEPGKTGVVRLYELVDQKNWTAKKTAELAGHKDAVYALAFSPDGKSLATAGYDRTILIWTVPPSAKPAPRLTLTDHSDSVYGLAFHPSGKLLASAAADRAVKVWDVPSGRRLYTLGDPTDWVYAVAWSPDGRRLAAAGADRSIRLWEADASGGRLSRSVFAHDRPVSRLAFSGFTLFSASEDRTVKLWDATTLSETKALSARPDDVLAFAARVDGKQIAVGLYNGVLQLIDPATGKVTATPLPAKPKPATVTSVTPSHAPRGRTLTVRFDGSRLDTARAVKSSAEGVKAAIRDGGRTPTRLEVELTIPNEIPPGPVQLTLVSEAGESSPTRFWVDRFPAIPETGPTDSARQGMPVSPPATITGKIDRAGDIDFFRFKAAAGQELGAQAQTAVEKSRFDPVVILTDGSGQILAEGGEGRLGFTVPAAGTYAIAIRDREYRGGSDFDYRLHVGPIPVVTGVFPLGVNRGVESEVQVRGVNLGSPGGITVKVRPGPDAAVGSRLAVPLTRQGGDPLGQAEVVIGEFPSVRIPPDGSAELSAVPGTADGLLHTPGSTSTVRFRARKGQRLIVESHAARFGSPADTTLEILDASGRPVPRATLRCIARTFSTFRDNDSASPGIRLEAWNELGVDDLLYVGGELIRIHALPKGPDDDCRFYTVGGKRVGFLDTTPTHHAMGSVMYKVEVHPPGRKLPSNGMPTFTLYYRNDDGGPGYDRDSRVFFEAPADGEYQVRLSDSAGAGGPTHAFRITVRPPQPDFAVRLTPTAPRVWKNGAVPVTVTADRIDGFEGPISVQLVGLTAPFRSSSSVIDAGQESTTLALAAGSEVVPATSPLRLVARATIDGKEVVREATGGPPTVIEPGDLVTSTSSTELAIRPGAESKIVVKVERRIGHTGRVPVEFRGLPHGVRVLHIGLNGILILPGEKEREVVLYAEPWVKPLERPIVITARSERKGTDHAAPPVVLTVEN